MTPFFAGLAIGVGAGAVILALCVMIAVIALAIRFGVGVFHFARRDIAHKWKTDRAAFAKARSAHGKMLTPAQAFNVSVIRARRIMRHPIRERAFIAESFRALRDPRHHRWSDGLS